MNSQMDRFITTRSAMDVEAAHLNLMKENDQQETSNSQASECKEEYQKRLAASLSVDTSGRILAFKQKAPAPPEGHEAALKGLYTENVGQAPSKKQFRHVPQTQERILDAPDLVDDYYLNLMDWNSQNMVSSRTVPQPTNA
jgi:cell division cycle protein 20 (cofactor of APC complex)